MIVTLGGQTVQVRVTTTQVSGLQAQAAAEAALVTIAANRVAAELAETNAEAAAVLTAADAIATAADAEATAGDRAAIDTMADEVAAYVAAVPPDVTYETDALGRAAVADGEDYWVRVVNGLQLYHRTNSTTSNAVTVSGFPTINVILPSIRYFGQAQGAVMLEYISGSGTTSNTYDLKVKNPLILLSGTGENHIYEWQLPFACQGSHNVRIYQNDETTLFLGLSVVYAPTGEIAAIDSFQKYDWMRARRLPSPIGDNLGTASQLIALAAPNTATADLSKAVQTFALQMPSENHPTFIERIDEKNYVVKTWGCATDDTDDQLDSDHTVWVMKDLSASMSLAETTCAAAYALNSDWLIRNGQEFRYNQLLSNSLPGGTWAAEQPSTHEPVDRYGLIGDLVSGYHIVGLNHGGAMGNIAGDVTIKMDGVALDLAIGESIYGDELVFEQRFDVYRTITASPVQNGETLYRHTFNSDGCTIYKRMRLGRALAFDAGLVEIEVGDTIVGGTSGAESIVRSIPLRQQSGTWGSTKAGTMHVEHVSGTWQDNETILVGGVASATVNGTLGPQVGVANSYGVLMCNTTVNRIKMTGYDALTVGTADGTQRPTAADISAGRSWAVVGDTFSAYHTVNMDGTGKGVYRRMFIPSGQAMTPMGTLNSTKVFVDDRDGGNRKVCLNWCSSISGPSATDATLAEGEFETEYVVGYRYGVPA